MVRKHASISHGLDQREFEVPMKKITVNDFSGGIQESNMPNDFSTRQWSQLKGFIPKNSRTFESQWNIVGVGGRLAPLFEQQNVINNSILDQVDLGAEDANPNEWENEDLIAAVQAQLDTFGIDPEAEEISIFIALYTGAFNIGQLIMWGFDGVDSEDWVWVNTGAVGSEWQSLTAPPAELLDTLTFTPGSQMAAIYENGNAWYHIPDVNYGVFDSYGIATPYGPFAAVYPLVSSQPASQFGGEQDSPFLVAIHEDGTLWWTNQDLYRTPFTNTTNFAEWFELTTAQNLDVDGAAISVLANEDYKFICDIPLQVYKYVVEVDEEDETNPSKDTPLADALQVATGVLINSTTVNGLVDQLPQQVLVAYVDSEAQAVKIISFPNLRRTPMHDKDAGDFIKAYIGNDTYVGFDEWLNDGDSVYNGDQVTGYTNWGNFSDGSTHLFHFGTAVPGSGLGNPLDYYFRTGSDPCLYIKTSSTVWYAIPDGVTNNDVWFSTDTSDNGFGDTGYIETAYTYWVQVDSVKEDFAYVEGDVLGVWVRTIIMGEGTYTEVAGATDRGMHPYTYLDINAALLPGRGIIPRANVGTSKNGLLLLGDIEWRSDLSQDTPSLTSKYLYSTSGTTSFNTREFQIVWPADVPSIARVIFNEGGGDIYLKDDENIVADILSATAAGGTATFTTLQAHGFQANETVEISNLGALYNGTYTIDSVTSYTFSIDFTYTGGDVQYAEADNDSPNSMATLTTVSNHILFAGQRVTVSNVGAPFDGTFIITSITDTTFLYKLSGQHDIASFEVDPVGQVIPGVPSIIAVEGGLVVDSSDLILRTESRHGFFAGDQVYVSIPDETYDGGEDTDADAVMQYNEITGTYTIKRIINSYEFVIDNSFVTRLDTRSKESNDTAGVVTVTLKTKVAHNFAPGNEVRVKGVGPKYDSINGAFILSSAPSGSEELEYEHDLDGVDDATIDYGYVVSRRTLPNNETGIAQSPIGRAVVYTKKIIAGEYYAVPDSWTYIWVTASTLNTKIKAVLTMNTAYHLLNDTNTGPHRGAAYFATGGDIDTFDPRAVLQIGKTDVVLSGMHVLGDSVIAITTGGGELDGVHKIRGYLSRLIQYGTQSDPNAVRIELLRGGLGAPARTSTKHKNYSTVWSEAGVVVFLDRLGGVWYTNGQIVDRLDRIGPKSPLRCTDDDHVAQLGNQLFAWRDGRLLCFTMMDSSSGTSGSGCWTEIVLPVENITSMVGAGEYLYFISRGIVFAMSTKFGKAATWEGHHLNQTVTTPVLGDSSNHRRVNWHRFGVTYDGPGVISSMTIQARGLFEDGYASAASYTQEINADDIEEGQFPSPVERSIPAGIGPHPIASGTVVFTGQVRLIAASFWVTGDYQLDGYPQ